MSVLDIPASAVTVSAAERMILTASMLLTGKANKNDKNIPAKERVVLRGGQGAVREKMWQW